MLITIAVIGSLGASSPRGRQDQVRGGRIERWLREFGATPGSRAELAQMHATGGLAAEIARRRAQNGKDAARATIARRCLSRSHLATTP